MNNIMENILEKTITEKYNDLNDLLWLAAHDILFFSTNNEGVTDVTADWYAFILISDCFDYASADAMYLPISKTSEIKNLYIKFGFDGVLAWCAIELDRVPLKELISEKYIDAVDYIMERKLPHLTIHGMLK